MKWTKLKTAAVVTAAVILGGGMTAVVVNKLRPNPSYNEGAQEWQVRYFDSRILQTTPPQVMILPARFPQSGSSGSAYFKMMGLGQTVQQILSMAYGISSTRIVTTEVFPDEKYDFISNLPSGQKEALQQSIKEKFGYIGKRETREMDVLILSVRNTAGRGLKRSSSQDGSSRGGLEEMSIVAQPISILASHLESRLNIPVIDRTGLTGKFDIEMKWDGAVSNPHRNLEIKKAVADQLGLQLIPSRERIEVLIVERVRN